MHLRLPTNKQNLKKIIIGTKKKKKGKHNFIIQQLSDNWCQVVKKHTLVLDVIQHKMAIFKNTSGLFLKFLKLNVKCWDIHILLNSLKM